MSETKKQVPSVGRIVHYVIKEGESKGEHRPAIIVSTWAGNGDFVDLCVFLNKKTDRCNEFGTDNTGSSGAVPYSEDTTILGSWHWPEFVASK